MNKKEEVLSKVTVGEIENPVTLKSVQEKLEQIDAEESEDIFTKTVQWLAEHGLTEGDIMADDDGEYVYLEEEVGTPGEDGYDVVKKKIYLHKVI